MKEFKFKKENRQEDMLEERRKENKLELSAFEKEIDTISEKYNLPGEDKAEEVQLYPFPQFNYFSTVAH